jgi:cobalt-zinc-cadmium efflux system protein
MSEGHSHDHSHALRQASIPRIRLTIALVGAFVLVEGTAALIGHSLALLSDALHQVTDLVTLAVSLWAARLALRPATPVWTFGLFRAEILSAAANGVTMVGGALLIAFEAVLHLVTPPQVDGGLMIEVSVIGLLINLTVAWILRPAMSTSLNLSGAMAHIVTDLWGYLATVVAGITIVTTGLVRADAIASLLIVIVMMRSAWHLLHDAGVILLEGAPNSVNLETVRLHLLETEGVVAVHDLHSWLVTSDLPALSAHVVVEVEYFSSGRVPAILDHLQSCIADHFDVEHSTFQLEPPEHQGHEIEGHS